MINKEYMTKNGYDELQKELKKLKSVERVRASQAIARAREFGDLSENAEYDAAKEAQAQLEARICNIEDKLARAEVIDTSKLSGNKVVFGAKVFLADLDTDDEIYYTIVGEDEADIKQNKISLKSPIAKAIIGAEIGDEITVRVPRGTREFEILDIQF